MMNRTNSPFKYIAVYFVALTLTGCNTISEERETIDLGTDLKPKKTRLELPPDLVDTTTEVIVNRNFTEEEVVPQTVGITMLDNGTERWLEIDAPAEQVWPKLVNYWGEIGAPLILANPETGIMETDWVQQDKRATRKKKGVTGNILISILTDITDQVTSLDKYTLRMERKDDMKTLVYLGHRGSKKIQTSRATMLSNAEWDWVETGQDPEKIRLVMQSIRYRLKLENA